MKSKNNISYPGNSLQISFVAFLVLLFLAIGCKKKTSEPEERPRPGTDQDSLVLLPEGSDVFEVVINSSVTYQIMDNFSASDSWGVQYAGKWPTSKSNTMADWLFSMDTTENGQPLGIGLSAWRFNIGAGSAEQGEESGITDEWRRAQSFLNNDGTYNWNKQAGQQWFLQAAEERGVEQFIGFSNSPPVQYTKNGKAYGDNQEPENLAEEEFQNFAGFLMDVSQGIKNKTGIEFDYISPVNEPQWNWTHGGQEGCYMTNETFRQFVNVLNQRLNQSTINSKILVTEAGEWTFLYGNGNTIGNQIDYFFGAGSPVNNASNLARIIAGHSYYTTTPPGNMQNIREQVLVKALSIPDLKVWSTEYCPLGNGDLQALGWSSWKKDLGMDVALYVAGIIYHDLCFANVSAWQWWLAISPYNYPDGLIYISKDKVNGSYSDSKLMWALGNYSRFIRPGAQRLKTEYSHENLYISAFSHPEDQTLSIVVVNASEATIPLKLNLNDEKSTIMSPYITSGGDTHKLLPLKKFKISSGFEMPGRSIITFTLKD